MKKILLSMAVLFFMSMPGMAGAQTGVWGKPDPVIINIDNEEQKTNYWCWPALIRQIINWRGMGQAPSQCEIVNIANAYKGWQGINCCEDPNREECARLGDEGELKNLVALYGGRVTDIEVPTTPEEIYNNLVSRKLLLMLVEFSGTTNKHLYMIRGISWDGDEAMLVINDPAVSQSQTVKFSEFKDTWFQAFAVE